MIEHARLLELVHYDPETGLFHRKIKTTRQDIGDVAGNTHRGYVELSVDGQVYRAHRLAWFYVYGVWPSKYLDHKDLDKSNNRIANLRESTASQNIANSRHTKRAKKFKGVTAYNTDKYFGFKASITVNRVRHHLGVFVSEVDAAKAYDAAALSYFGEFALTNHKLGAFL